MKPEAFNRLLRQLKTSEAAFRQFYEYYLPKIKYHVVSKYGGSVEFEDVAHEFFTKLIRMESPPNVDNPNAWVYRVCDNIALDMLRKTSPFTELNEQITAAPQQGGFTVSEAESNSDFFTLLSHLDEDSAELVRLVIWEGYNLKEAAAILGIGYGAAR